MRQLNKSVSRKNYENFLYLKAFLIFLWDSILRENVFIKEKENKSLIMGTLCWIKVRLKNELLNALKTVNLLQ